MRFRRQESGPSIRAVARICVICVCSRAHRKDPISTQHSNFDETNKKNNLCVSWISCGMRGCMSAGVFNEAVEGKQVKRSGAGFDVRAVGHRCGTCQTNKQTNARMRTVLSLSRCVSEDSMVARVGIGRAKGNKTISAPRQRTFRGR